MIYEYAIDPSIAATWFRLRDGRFFKDRLGLGTPRIVSSFPFSWRERVWSEFYRSQDCTDDLSIKRMETMLDHLCRKTVKRRGLNWDNRKSWLENAESEHSLVPFDAIVAKNNPRDHDCVICVDSIDSDTPLWFRKHQLAVLRDERIQELTSPMLRIATQVVFVDPYFSTKERFIRPMERYLRIIAKGKDNARKRGYAVNGIPHIEICRSSEGGHCHDAQLSSIVPPQLNLIVRTLDSMDREDAFHNRYILTDVGGLLFPYGLDEKPGTTDDLTVLNEDLYLKRWSQYANGAPEFNQVRKQHIDGQAGG